MKIVEYVNNENIVVEFQDEHKFRKKAMYTNFRTGSIKNPYDKTVFSIGYIGDGEYMAKRNKKPTREYHCWQNMLERLFFASTFWTKLQNIFGHCCKTFLDIVACPNWTKLQCPGWLRNKPAVKPLQTLFNCYSTRYGNGSSEFSSSCACSLKY